MKIFDDLKKSVPESDATEWLFAAIEKSTLENVRAAIQKGANVNYWRVEGTALHAAVKHNKPEIVKLLLDQGADVCLVDKNFQTPIELAARQKHYDILEVLLERRNQFKKETFQQYLNYCFDNYVDKASEEENRHNHSMIAHFVSRLSGINIRQHLQNKLKKNYEHYVIQLYSFSKDAQKILEGKQAPLHGWQIEEFLPLRIYSFFEILVKLKRGIIKPYSASLDLQQQLIVQIEQELLLSIELLRTARDRLIISNIEDPLSLDEEEDQDGFMDEAMPERIEKLYVALSKRIVRHFLALKEGEFYNMSIGFKNHEMTLSCLSHQGGILGRIDNLGAGCERHELGYKNEIKFVKPFKLFSVLPNVNGNNSVKVHLITYVEENLKIKNKENHLENPKNNQKIFADNKRNLDQIYGGAGQIKQYQTFQGEWPQINWRAIQTSGNCVVESQQFGLMLRSYEKKFFTWITNEERKCATDKIRMFSNKDLSKEEYWLMRNVKIEDFTKGRMVKYCEYQLFNTGVFDILFEVLVVEFFGINMLNAYNKYHVEPFLRSLKSWQAQQERPYLSYGNEQQQPTLTTLADYLNKNYFIKSEDLNDQLANYYDNTNPQNQNNDDTMDDHIDDDYYSTLFKKTLATLFFYIYKGRDYDFKQLFKIASQAFTQEPRILEKMQALNCLHNKDFIHLDEKMLILLKQLAEVETQKKTYCFTLFLGLRIANLAVIQQKPHLHKEAIQYLTVAQKSIYPEVRLLAFYNVAISYYYLKHYTASKQADHATFLLLQQLKNGTLKYAHTFHAALDQMYIKRLEYSGCLQIDNKNFNLAEQLFEKSEKILNSQDKTFPIASFGLGLVNAHKMKLAPKNMKKVYYEKAKRLFQKAWMPGISQETKKQLNRLETDYKRLSNQSNEQSMQTEPLLKFTKKTQTPSTVQRGSQLFDSQLESTDQVTSSNTTSQSRKRKRQEDDDTNPRTKKIRKTSSSHSSSCRIM